ncbi:MAG: hypothetical protein ABIS50_01855 [Luteolibacter sp.]|uniref:hypothetical protein n=1 Tax=Luteolibacter sp. TaxID=1962973 RepID=UPI003264402F
MRKAAWLALAGTLIAGTFGIIHDQITYTISPEYFTRMKFDQFHAWDFGFPRRVFVAEIGFLATWWVGLIAAWFLARVALRKFQFPAKSVMRTMASIVGFVVLLGVAAYFTGPSLLADRSGWRESLESIRVIDQVAFNRVAAIHLASYGGALIGWIAAMAWFLSRPKSRIFPKE